MGYYDYVYKPPIVIGDCAHCGKAFARLRVRGARPGPAPRYCSTDCLVAARAESRQRRRGAARRRRRRVSCRVCGEHMLSPSPSGLCGFCSGMEVLVA